MIPPGDWWIVLPWALWGTGWALAAARTRPIERAEPRSSRGAHIVLMAAAFGLLLGATLRVGPLGRSLFPASSAHYGAGLTITVLGLAFATWARILLGRNWSGTVAIRSEQVLVLGGPFAVVRHPIYSGILAAFMGSAIAVGELGALLGLAIATFAYWRKIGIEEQLLMSEFGEQYVAYRERVGALLPFRRFWTGVRGLAERGREDISGGSELDETIDRLCEAGKLSVQDARTLRRGLPAAIAESSYVLQNLGAHIAIGVIFAFDVVPLPLGTIARVAWVAGNRVYESLLGTPERARVHSVRVLFVAAIPWIGYAAYLLPLRRESAELSWLLAHRLSYRLDGTSFDEFLAGKPRPIQRVGHWLLPGLSAAAGGSAPISAPEIEVRVSPLGGRGVFTLVPQRAGQVISEFRVEREVTREVPLRPEFGERPEHCPVIDGRVLLVASPERYVNHSCDPNSYLRYGKTGVDIVARRAIDRDEELTFDYLINNAGGDSWSCGCGASRCRGETGKSFFALPEETQREYLPLLAPWFAERHAAQLEHLASSATGDVRPPG